MLESAGDCARLRFMFDDAMESTEAVRPLLLQRIDEEIAIIRLNRPARLNALTREMVADCSSSDYLGQLAA